MLPIADVLVMAHRTIIGKNWMPTSIRTIQKTIQKQIKNNFHVCYLKYKNFFDLKLYYRLNTIILSIKTAFCYAPHVKIIKKTTTENKYMMWNNCIVGVRKFCGVDQWQPVNRNGPKNQYIYAICMKYNINHITNINKTCTDCYFNFQI